MRNEADTRAVLIDPKLKASGWRDTQVTREHYYVRDPQYTPGRVIIRGDRVTRGEAKRVDYLLRLTDAFPIAVVEAKGRVRIGRIRFGKSQKLCARPWLGLCLRYKRS